jgi:RNA polymerase sigma-70 factor (ECF subfamily)
MPALSDSQRELLLAELGGLRKFCFSLTGNAADADDLLQVTVERVLQKGLPEDADMARWAYRVCKNAWVDETRSRGVRHKHAEVAGELDRYEPSAEQAAGIERQVAAVFEQLEQMPDEQRLALTLVAVEGKTYNEAADILGVPIGTIMSRVARARKQLVRLYESPETGHET